MNENNKINNDTNDENNISKRDEALKDFGRLVEVYKKLNLQNQ
jgi:hypothetical protein